jgi:hypothetical protein
VVEVDSEVPLKREALVGGVRSQRGWGSRSRIRVSDKSMRAIDGVTRLCYQTYV